MRGAFTYIMSNKSHTIYVGSTENLPQRVLQHKARKTRGAFTTRYRFTRLVWYELHPTIAAARKRELQIKPWHRKRKVALIQATNPNWDDLSRRFLELLMLE